MRKLTLLTLYFLGLLDGGFAQNEWDHTLSKEGIQNILTELNTVGADNLTLNDLCHAEVVVADLMGNVKWQTTACQYDIEIQKISNWPRGLYFIDVRTDGKSCLKKLIRKT